MEPLGIAGIVIAVLAGVLVLLVHWNIKDFKRDVAIERADTDQARIDELALELNRVQDIANKRLLETSDLTRELEKSKAELTQLKFDTSTIIEDLNTAKSQLEASRQYAEATSKDFQTAIAKANDLQKRNAELEFYEKQNTELLNEVERLRTEILSNLAASRPKPWKRFLSNLISPSEANQS